MSKDNTRWDVYTWVGHGEIKVRESNVPLKEAKKAKEKWIAKSSKHEAFIAAHTDKKLVKTLLKDNEVKIAPKKKAAEKKKAAPKKKDSSSGKGFLKKSKKK